MPWFSQRLHRLVCRVAVVPLATVLIALPAFLVQHDPPRHSVHLTTIASPPEPVAAQQPAPAALLARRLLAVQAANEHVMLVTAYWQDVHATAVQEALRAARAAARSATARQPPQAATAAYSGSQSTAAPASTSFGSLSDVVQCIKNHESGNYSESSHPGTGSGAFQFIPGTWQSYFGRWQAEWNAANPKYLVPYYSLAYQAPPWVQDAVLAYALTHGGAGNWSMRWGNDPCTAGLPGGG